MSDSHFGDRLAAAVAAKKTAAMVGLDPRFEQLPDAMQDCSTDDRAEVAKRYLQFCCEVIDVVAPLVAVVKPQSAFFELLGPPGGQALAGVIQYARQHNLLVVLDGKRNDVGSTATAYAAAYLGQRSAWKADALTVSPYLGADSLQPFVDVCEAEGSGMFVLVKTSNPGGGMLQDRVADGQPLYQAVGQHVETLAMDTVGLSGYGSVGAVVGATYPEQLAELRELMPHAWLLVPGFGAQGGTAADVRKGFDSQGLGAVVNSSRGITFAYRRAPYDQSYGQDRWQAAVEAATLEMVQQLAV